jgi:hypothetical protein
MQPLLLITNGFLNVRWQVKFKTDGTELPAPDASSRSLYWPAMFGYKVMRKLNPILRKLNPILPVLFINY